MENLDKIIESLTICVAPACDCEKCPYHGGPDCSEARNLDTLLLLKELRGKPDAEKLVGQIAAQEQAIETLHLINAKLEGKVEAYENMLQRLVHE